MPNGAMSKLDDLKRLRDLKFGGGGESRPAPPIGDGYALLREPTLKSRLAGVAPGPPKPKRGRPLAKDADKTLAKTKPWEAEGMSRRTWFRRRGK